MVNLLRMYFPEIVAPLLAWLVEFILVSSRTPIPLPVREIFPWLVLLLIIYGILLKAVTTFINSPKVLTATT